MEFPNTLLTFDSYIQKLSSFNLSKLLKHSRLSFFIFIDNRAPVLNLFSPPSRQCRYILCMLSRKSILSFARLMERHNFEWLERGKLTNCCCSMMSEGIAKIFTLLLLTENSFAKNLLSGWPKRRFMRIYLLIKISGQSRKDKKRAMAVRRRQWESGRSSFSASHKNIIASIHNENIMCVIAIKAINKVFCLNVKGLSVRVGGRAAVKENFTSSSFRVFPRRSFNWRKPWNVGPGGECKVIFKRALKIRFSSLSGY